MRRYKRFWQSSVAAALWIAGLSGCQQAPVRPHGFTLALGGTDQGPKLTARQAADVQVALGRSLEMRGENEQAMAVYREALRRDPNRADAYLRLAILCDQQGKFDESAGLYRKALAAQPGNAEVYCDMGYSLSLQRRWAEAEMNLRQALALTPDHRRAHNNLGLVLAHAGRWDDALVAFGKGGCDPAEAHVNLAFVLTLEHCWPEARTHYEQALALQPASASAKKGLEQLQGLMAKGEGTEDPLGTGNRSRRVRGSARDEPNPAAALGVPTAQSSQVPMGSRSLDSRSPATAVSLPTAETGRSPTAVTPAVYAPLGAFGPPATPGEIRPSRQAVDPAMEPPMPRCNEIQSATPPFPTPMPAASQVVATPPPSNPATTRGSMPVSQEALEPEPAPAVVSPLVRLQQQVEALCGDTGKDVEVRAESATSLRIRFTVHSAEDGYKLATKVLWLPELGPYQVALDIRVVL